MLTLTQLAAALGARPTNCGPEVEVTHVAHPARANADSLVFAEDAAALAAALRSDAGAVVVGESLAFAVGHPPVSSKPLLWHSQPRLAFARAAQLLRAAEASPGVHPSAVIAATAVLRERVAVAACAVIGDHATIGAGTTISSGAVIGCGVSIGTGCRIHPRVVIYPGVTLGDRVVVHAGAVLGADGFGYVRDAATGEYLQFPQQGTLVIEDEVEIGANSTIDRGALEETRIGRGSKIDNLVHIAHNVTVGRNVAIASQTGISGSTRIGDGAVFGGQVGIGDHAEVGAGVILGGQAGVLPHKSLQGAGKLFWGTPAKPVKEHLRELATLTRLVRRRKRDEE